jgi:hypothetical protein
VVVLLHEPPLLLGLLIESAGELPVFCVLRRFEQ